MKKTIAFIGDTSFDLSSSQMFSGAKKAAEECGINLARFTIEHANNPDRFPGSLDLISGLIKEFKPDGIMFLGWSLEILENWKRFTSFFKDVPMMSIGRVAGEGIPSVIMDGAFHVKEILNHLTTVHNYKRIAFIAPFVHDERYKAYEDYMKEHGLFRQELVLGRSELDKKIDWFYQGRAKKIIDILFNERKAQPEAIMSMYTHEAVILLDELKKAGLSVPGDIALTSWEDTELGRYSSPSITSVYYPFYEQAYEGFKSLAGMIGNGRAPLMNPLKGELRVRRSCGCNPQNFAYIKPLDSISGKNDHSLPGPGIPGGADDFIKTIEHMDPGLEILDKVVLIDGFIADIRERTDTNFISALENYIFSHNCTPDDLFGIQRDFLRFRSEITRDIDKYPSVLLIAENIWLKSQIIIQDHIETVTGHNEFVRQIDIHLMQEIGQNIVTNFDIEKLMTVLEANLSRVQIPNCHIFLNTGKNIKGCLKKHVFSYINGKKKIQSGKKGIRMQIFGDKHHVYTFYILHIREEFLGVILFEPGPEDERLYYTLSTELSSAIHGAFVVSGLKKARNQIIKNLKIIEESNVKLSKLDSMKNEFIANITHDFRSPLTIILNSADLALRHYENADPEDNRKRYNTIFNASLKLKMSIDRLLDLAKMDAGGLRLNIKKLRIRSFIEDIALFYQSAASSTNIRIDYSLPGHEIDDFYTDGDKLEEILNNIISNALKFVNPDRGKINIDLNDNGPSVEITVSDNGIGIPAGKLEEIFGRFEKLDEGIAGRYKGTGIGLSFAKELTGYLRGNITAMSDGMGKGSSFKLKLPKGRDVFRDMEISDEQTSPDNTAARRHELLRSVEADLSENPRGADEIQHEFRDLNGESEFESHKGIILIVDDNYHIREIVKEYLSFSGYKNFITATNGKNGIEAIYSFRPDLVICDFNMPQMRGDELQELIISNPDFKRIPILFLTGLMDRNIILERKRKGAIAFLSKPVDENDLIVTVDLHIKKFMEYKQLLQQASTDELTGLANKNTILKFLRDHVMLRNYRNLSLIFMDLDLFKNFNDKNGHQAGDALLAETGSIIRSSLRNYDRAGRYGGEEFLIVLPETDMLQALIVAEKLRSKIRNKIINYHGKPLKSTASFGTASLIDGEDYIRNILKIDSLKDIFEVGDIKKADWENIDAVKEKIKDLLVEMADEALYRAKDSGRDRVIPFSNSQ